jgi:ABC-type lipoprotein export system ATPase subunit
MLITDSVRFQYKGQNELQFPDLQCKSGEILLVTGHSGCGKTTLLHLMAGILTPKSGQIRIDGKDIAPLSEANKDRFRAENIGLVYQKAHFLAALPIWDNLMLPGWLGKSALQKKHVEALCERLAVGHTLKKYPAQLSVGEQQRISIIRAIANAPKLLLADEPTSATPTGPKYMPCCANWPSNKAVPW